MNICQMKKKRQNNIFYNLLFQFWIANERTLESIIYRKLDFSLAKCATYDGKKILGRRYNTRKHDYLASLTIPCRAFQGCLLL